MVFNSVSFLIFFAGILGLYHTIPSWIWRKRILLLASYYFYAAFNIAFTPILLFTTLVDWVATQKMAATDKLPNRRIYLAISLISNLGLLGFFKYGSFLQTNIIQFLNWLGISYHPLVWNIVLPAGISFYTFQSLSYTIDVYRKTCRPARTFLDFALFVSFFPQLVAGPIVRAKDFLPQLDFPRQATRNQFVWGLLLLLFGLFQKIVLADAILAPVVISTYDSAATLSMLDAWAGTISFAGQVFFDFSGYSTCAIGAAMCFGFALPDNFRHPYAAAGFSDFWQRWHISLSSWLRDYLYIPLGGNRKGPSRTYANLFMTMLIGGLWHGASWRFVIWGALHALFLCLERIAVRLWPTRLLAWKRAHLVMTMTITFLLVCLTWVFFRAPSLERANAILHSMFSAENHHSVMDSSMLGLSLSTMFFVVAYQWRVRNKTAEQIWTSIPEPGKALVLAVVLFLLLATPVQHKAFIYFQF